MEVGPRAGGPAVPDALLRCAFILVTVISFLKNTLQAACRPATAAMAILSQRAANRPAPVAPPRPAM